MPLLQLLNTLPTDSITSKIPDAKAELSQLKSLSLDDLLNRFINGVVELAINVMIAVLVFYIGKFIIKKLYHVVENILIRRQTDRSLSTFILSLIRIVLYFILIITVIGILGLETSSFLALFASAGVAIGMALSGTLQNFAGGVLILLLKPYKIGDYIEAQGYAGTVTEIQIFNTIINTYDNKSIIIPNGVLSTSSINNYSREDYRRVSWDVGISYGDSVDAAREELLKIMAEDDRVVKRYIEDDREEREQAPCPPGDEECIKSREPEAKRGWLKRLLHIHAKARIAVNEATDTPDTHLRQTLPRVDRSPVVLVSELADSSVNLTVRAWVRSADYWSVFYSINEKIYKRLPQAGVNFPFPQMDVHLDQA